MRSLRMFTNVCLNIVPLPRSVNDLLIVTRKRRRDLDFWSLTRIPNDRLGRQTLALLLETPRPIN